VHPTDAGHAAAARFVTTMCDTALNSASAGKSGALSPLPPPLHSDAFQHVDWRDAAALDPIKNDGWRRAHDEKNNPTWDGSGISSRIAFDWSGCGVVAVFTTPPDDLRRIQFCIDGAAFQTLATLEQPKRQLFVLAQNLAPGHHTVELRFSNEAAGDATGPVRLRGLASIGVTAE
jgi:hypothetical protein